MTTKMQRRIAECYSRPPERRPIPWYEQSVKARISAMVFYLCRAREHAHEFHAALDQPTNAHRRCLARIGLREARKQVRRLIRIIRKMERTGEVLA